MNQFEDENLYKDVVVDNRIRPSALHAAYLSYIQTQRFSQAHDLLNQLYERFADDQQVQRLNIDLLIHEKNYSAAMDQVKTMVAGCCPTDELIDAALAVRRKIVENPLPYPKNRHPTVSLCMVVKNELAGLGACLEGAKSLVDEIIVVDTGSTDRTKDVADIFGARLFDFKWDNDFAAARNFSLEQASGDWVLILDADEIISKNDHVTLRSMIDRPCHQNIAYRVETRNYTNLNNAIGWHANDGQYKKYETGSGWFPTLKVRLFPRLATIRFHYPVHERVDPSIRKNGIPIADCSIPVHHYGHLNETKKRKKAQLYFQLGYAKLKQFGDDLEAIRELAVQAGQLEKWNEAVKLWQYFIAIKPDYAEAYTNLAGIFWQLGRYEDALASATSAEAIDPGLKEAHYNKAISLMFTQKVAEAITALERLLVTYPDYMAAQFMLAAAYSFAGEFDKSVSALSACKSKLQGETLALAAEDLIKKLNESKNETYGNLLRKAMGSIGVVLS